MIEIASYFQNENLESLLESLRDLPEAIRPIYFGDSENPASTENLISDKQRFEKFVLNNRDGFFLHGKTCLYDIKLYVKQPSHIYLDLPAELGSCIEQIFRVLSRSDPGFAYAADSEERKHRNRCYKTIGANHIEDWVGRDTSKYVPGLYFYTLLSKSLLDRHSVDLLLLKSAALSCNDLGSDGERYLFKFYAESTSWQLEAERLDGLCHKTEGIFSIREVKNAVKSIDNLMEYDDIIYSWR